MTNLKLVLAVFVILSLFTGCLQVDTKVNLNKDGSGTIEETVLMKSEFINMMKEFFAAFDSTKSEDFNMFNEEELKTKVSDYGEDVKYISGEKYSIQGYEGFKALYSFKDINKIKLDPSPEDKVPFGDEIEESEETPAVDDFLRFKFLKGNPSTLEVEFPKPQGEKSENTGETTEYEDSTFNNEGMEKLNEMFNGLKFSMILNFNDGIDETDASFVENNTVTLLQVDFTEIMKNKDVMKNLERKKPETMEAFKEAVGDLKGIKIEFKDKITIKF